MKAQLRINSLKRPSTNARTRRPVSGASDPVRAERLEVARRRIASGYYDSDVCLDITVRRLMRELKRPAPVVVVTPGRGAQKRVKPTKPPKGR